MSKLQSAYGMGGRVLEGVSSFLTDRTQQVLFGGSLSREIVHKFGVPQGSVLGPLLFLLYTAEVFDKITSHGLTGHCYADDTRVYISSPAADSQLAARRLADCVAHLDRWMDSN
jgi:hypothetical protein